MLRQGSPVPVGVPRWVLWAKMTTLFLAQMTQTSLVILLGNSTSDNTKSKLINPSDQLSLTDPCSLEWYHQNSCPAAHQGHKCSGILFSYPRREPEFYAFNVPIASASRDPFQSLKPASSVSLIMCLTCVQKELFPFNNQIDKSTDKFYSKEGRNSAEVGFAIPTQMSQVRFSVFPNLIRCC